jgi:hypothetical protein
VKLDSEYILYTITRILKTDKSIIFIDKLTENGIPMQIKNWQGY